METAVPLNTLDIILRFVEALFAPLSVVIVGFILNKSLTSFEHKQHSNENLAEERLRLYKKAAPKLNDIFCFLQCIGHWQTLTPYDVIENKRALDKSMNVYKPLWSEDVFEKYNSFMNLCFSTFNNNGHSARINTDRLFKWERGKNWQEDWRIRFKVLDGGKDYIPRVKESYNALMDAFRKDLNFGNVKEKFVIHKLGARK